MMRALFVVAMLAFLIASPGNAQIEIDLATTPAALSIWGGNQGDVTGAPFQVGDINGDGLLDIAFAQGPWRNGAGEEVGRVCVFFGPHAFPVEHDLFSETAPLCIEGTTRYPIFLLDISLEMEDLDGDGIDDLLFGGLYFVSIFKGRVTWPPVLSAFSDATWSFTGVFGEEMQFGTIGDLNGDGVSDLVLSAGRADGPSGARPDSGEAYIFFGPAMLWPKREFDLNVDTPDVVIYGADGRMDNPVPRNGDYFGYGTQGMVANVLGDDTADLIMAAHGAAGASNLASFTGEVYVFRGRATWPAVIDTRNPSDVDLIVRGPGEFSNLQDVSVGDVDGDARPDLLVGFMAYSRPGLGRDESGGVFILKGSPTLSGIWDLAVSDADSTIVGAKASDWLGVGIDLADVNGDSYRDLIVSATGSDTPFARMDAGAVFVLSGCEGIEHLRDLALMPPALAIYGIDPVDYFGVQVRASDADNDGKADILAMSKAGHGKDNLRGARAGEIHLVSGRPFDTPPACTIAPDPGPTVEICGTTTDVTLDGSLSIVTNCSVTPQYRWMDGTTELRGWDVDPTFVVRPTATTEYRLEVRCGDCAGPCFETATVLVTVDPDVTPPGLGNTVRAYRAGTDVELEWGSVTEARTYSLYRGTQKENWPPTPLSSLTATTEALPDVPGPPNLYFYRVSGASCSGNEGP